eukprot:CAMPEP_0172842482 /NCGR_PEP_ID=MMETSP1075-20121228/30770_1 /TAXON_ID=2916 /ORGANISM="Ceratium fusus, Strain PA161109" /LENGTH=122 /DNA_ID=CAMNT_0013686613 /DNA_START=140 /DNA_END=508 /DNA_ORIENTATION=+
MAAKMATPKGTTVGLCTDCFKCNEDSKMDCCKICKLELFESLRPFCSDLLQFGHDALGTGICETFLLPDGHQKMAGVPCQPALTSQATKQAVLGSISAQASTMKRRDRDGSGAQAKRSGLRR